MRPGRALRLARSSLAPLAGLGLVVAVIAIYGLVARPNSSFFTAYGLSLIAKQSAIVGIGAVGMTAVIAAGGIDLSIGAVCALCSVVLALALNAGWPPGMALAVTLLAGITAGALNGRLVTALRLAPFIVTLGTMLVFRGVAEHAAGLRKIPAEPPAWLASLLEPPAVSGVPLVCAGVWIVVAAGLVMAFVLRRTVFGRHVFAVGSNEDAARVCGVPVERTKILAYAIGGACAALAGIFAFVDLAAQGDPETHYGLELDVIAAVVIGGGSLSGGRGSVLGSLLGALLMTTVAAGCAYAELSMAFQKIATGVLLVAAVAIDRSRRVR